MILCHRLALYGGLSLIFLASLPGQASSGFVNPCPNGVSLSCGGCHLGSPGAEMFNAFGAQVDQCLNGGAVDWSALYNLDADDDGGTHGYELGNADGVWQAGQTPGLLQGDPSPPGDCEVGDADADADAPAPPPSLDLPEEDGETGGCGARQVQSNTPRCEILA